MSLAPILLFTYNRPAHTSQTLEALLNNKLSKDSELFIFSDGYKNESDKANVQEVRKLIHSIDGFNSFKKINIIENKQNVGLAKNIIAGVTQIVNEYGKVIVLEDDLLTSPWFLTFMNEALDKFESDERIGHIHGFCYPIDNLPDAFLIKWVGSWGWATWKRSWQLFNADGNMLLKEIQERNLSREFDFNGNYPYTKMLQRQVNGVNDSWAIRWNATLFLNNLLSVNAGKSLVQNIGFDGTGIHSGKDKIHNISLYKYRLNTDIPIISENKSARKAFGSYYSKTNSFFAKAKRRISRYLRRI
jgi:hypothetical protein